MKGLLKGLRYISQIFDAKEPEMKIGNPTDVKHVAHIGWDNASSVTAPSWMQDFKAAPGGTSTRAVEPAPSQAGGGEPAGEGGGCRAEQAATDRPRRTTKGKGAGPSEGSRRDRRAAKAEAEGGGDWDAAAAGTKAQQRRRKPRGGTSSGGRSKSSAPGAEDDI